MPLDTRQVLPFEERSPGVANRSGVPDRYLAAYRLSRNPLSNGTLNREIPTEQPLTYPCERRGVGESGSRGVGESGSRGVGESNCVPRETPHALLNR